ncbi:MAG: hypothetical protein KTR19_08080 [Hyphomicrobiales bacterium]|nr:hypothetical protein [Hyphomicrobiales bacterium]
MRLVTSLFIAFALVVSVVLDSDQAIASATGCDNRQYSSASAPIEPNALYQEITLPYGYLCHLMHNNGTVISEQKAAYTASAGIYAPLVKDVCNWRIDFVYYDKKGDEFLRDEGETVSDCKKGASRNIDKKKTLPTQGTACAELMIDGERRFMQCHPFG